MTEARVVRTTPRFRSASRPVPKTKNTIRRMEKTPTLTTATPCRKLLTGVGATIAAGSHPCSGMTAALANPKTSSTSSSDTVDASAFPARIPPAVKSSVPVSV